MTVLLDKINNAVWGIPMLILILGCGLYYTALTKGLQFRLLIPSIKHFFRSMGEEGESEGCSSFRALCTALGATVGTGNLAGVAGAITIGGPGAVFWIWISAFLGMITKFCEAVLAVRFRKKTPGGEIRGGPMYVIEQGMGMRWTWLGKLYCVLGLVAALGVGNAVQINTVIAGISQSIQGTGIKLEGKQMLLVGMLAAILILLLFQKKTKGIGRVLEVLIPVATVMYLLLGVYTLAYCHDRILPALQAIVTGAFSPRAVTGGMVGSVLVCMRIGVSRGVFTNEAGMGTAGIAHGAANVRNPVDQGMMGIVEVFLDTVVICSITALAILVSGVPIPYGGESGVGLTIQAFSAVCGDWVGYLICLLLCVFAFATVLGWGVYGGQCAIYLFGERSWPYFVMGEAAAATIAGIGSVQSIWLVSDILNGLMAIPNLIALFWLSRHFMQTVQGSLSKK